MFKKIIESLCEFLSLFGLATNDFAYNLHPSLGIDNASDESEKAKDTNSPKVVTVSYKPAADSGLSRTRTSSVPVSRHSDRECPSLVTAVTTSDPIGDFFRSIPK